jgi:hypothetical protein
MAGAAALNMAEQKIKNSFHCYFAKKLNFIFYRRNSHPYGTQ